MNNRYYNPHENIFLITSVLAGDIIISNLLYWMFCSLFKCDFSIATMRQTMVASTLIYFACTVQNGVVLYRRKVSNHQIVMRVMKNTTIYAACCIILFTIGGFNHPSLIRMLAYWTSMFACISIFRVLVRRIVVMWRCRPSHVRNVVFAGSNDNAHDMFYEMTETKMLGFNVVGYFDHEPNKEFSALCKYLGTPAEMPEYLSKNKNIHEVYCCISSQYKDEILAIIRHCEQNIIHFYSMPNVNKYLHHRMYLNMLGNVPYLSLYNEPLSHIENRALKRLFDIAVSLTFLVTLFPFIFLAVAIITKITMPGPIFFRQKRTGLNGRDFYCLKFRSMKVNNDADTLQATENDPRKTKWGSIMRKTNIDEMPQFINVLLGQMSVVGPRPHMVKQTSDYSKIIENYMVRHYIKPGITGWSQVTGFRGETKYLSQMEGRVMGDIWYMEHWSIWLDIYIMYKTVANVLQGDKQAF